MYWKKMFEKLEELEKRYERIKRNLEDPEVFSNYSETQKLLQEKAEIEDTVRLYAGYKKVLKEIKDNEELLDSEEEIRIMAKEEILRLSSEKEKIETKLIGIIVGEDPLDKKNIFLEIRAGTGGEEAALFAGDLFRMYMKYAEKKGWKTEVASSSPSGRGGFKEVIATVSGKKVYSFLKYESGVHRVQRIPITEASGRIHTSAVTVAILPEAEEVEVHIDEKDLRVDTFRSSGKGGQHVNKTDSAIRITHMPTGIVISCQDERSQHQNRARAMSILRARLFEMQREAQEKEIVDSRRKQVGTGDRSEKIRTYNFPQDRVTDHRIGFSRHNLAGFLDGDIDQMIESLQIHFQTEAIRNI
jgi:peptide chain release factor 1